MGEIHTLKSWPDCFQAVLDGTKRFEARVNDRGFEVGDCLHLQEWDPNRQVYSGRETFVYVTHLMTDQRGWCLPGWVVMSIEPRDSRPSTSATVPRGGA